MKKIILTFLLSLVTVATGMVVPAQAKEPAPYAIAVIPAAPPVETHRVWAPLVERLSRETGMKFRLEVFDRMANFESVIWGGFPDFMFSSPIQTVVAHARHGYVPLVRGGNPVAIRLFVRDDSPIRNLNDLSGKKIAFVGNKNLCSVFMRHLLGRQQVKLSYLSEYSGSTRNVIKNVLLGKSDAGAVFLGDLDYEAMASRELLRPLFDSPKIAPHPLSAHPRVPASARTKVRQAILAIATTPDGAELLKGVRMASPVAADYERDLKALEEIDVVGLTDWGK